MPNCSYMLLCWGGRSTQIAADLLTPISHLDSKTGKVYVLSICFCKIPKESAWQRKKEK